MSVPGIKVYGADFSGAKNPGSGIWYAEGALREDAPGGPLLRILRVVRCDDRLDLFSAVHASRSAWGLDFPFSFPLEAQRRLEISSWEALLALAEKTGRTEFARLLEEAGLPSCEARCADDSPCCRLTDIAVSACSPLKKTNPNMRVMTWAGLKLLAALRRAGCTVYPFDVPASGASRVYEVYPSHTWRLAGLARSPDATEFLNRFSGRYGLKLEAEEEVLNHGSRDASDAVVACVTMGYALSRCAIENSSEERPAWAGEEEWEVRIREGIAVRIEKD